MKCIEASNGAIARVKDEDAFRMVAYQAWQYVPKRVWKARLKELSKQEENNA